ncbi:MAG: hypothetical protein Q9221_008592 [Calogaya cf. arnoldii]
MPSLEQLPNETLRNVLELIPDFVTLRNFTSAYPLASELLKHSHQAILVSLISRIEPYEYRNLVSATLAARYNPRAECCGYPLDTKDHSCDNPKPLDIPFTVSCIADPIEAVRDMASSCEDMDYHLKTFTASCFESIGVEPGKQKPLSATETHRIRRALWKFQLLCEVAYPRSTVESPRRRRQYAGTKLRIGGLMSWLSWEYAELQCIYLHLQNEYLKLAVPTTSSDGRQHKVPIRSQPEIVRKLATAVGFTLDDPTPYRLDSGRKGERLSSNFTHKAFPDASWFLAKSERSPSSWHDGFVNGPNEGWEILMRVQDRGDVIRWPLASDDGHGAIRLRNHGFCIWDKERIRDWGANFSFRYWNVAYRS